MKELLAKRARLARRKNRVRGRISGTRSLPRLSVTKSNTSLYCQVIDDGAGVTLFGVHSKPLTKGGNVTTATAEELGAQVAAKALEMNIQRVVFDRGGRQFTGRVAAVAEGARKAGLKI